MSIEDRMMECHLLFPSYGERGIKEVQLLVRLYEKALAEYSEAQIDEAFDEHIKSSARFPVVSDLVDHLKPVTCYRMNYGPDGYGAVYTAGHPYTRMQARLGVDLTAYAVAVSPAEARRAKLIAMAAAPSEIGTDETPEREPSAGSGMRLLSYDVAARCR